MHSMITPEIAARDHDPRVYFLLGIANWFLFLDHVPNNAVALVTLRNFGFSGAVDLFVLLGGYAAAVTYAKITLERGFIVGATRIFKRVWQLYAAYIVLFVFYINLISYVARQYAAPEIIDEFNITGIFDHTLRTLIRGLVLQAKPLNLEVLQLFIALMAIFPIVVFGMLRKPGSTLAGSIVLYLFAREVGWSLPSFPDGNWSLNPFCWQLLFALGAWFALAGPRQTRTIGSWQRLPALRIVALTYLLLTLTIVSAEKLPALARLIPDFVFDVFLPNDRENLGPWRIAHFLSLAFLFTIVVPRDWRGLQSPLVRPIMKCGEEWLAVFCAGVFLSFAAHLILITGPVSLGIQILVSIAGLSILASVAYYVSWSKRQDHKPTVPART